MHPSFQNAVDLNDLPQWSPWPARLLGTEPWSRGPRTVEDTEREYEKEKYASYRTFLNEHPDTTPEELKHYELGGDLEREVCIAVKENLYRTTLREAWDFQAEEYIRLLTPYIKETDIVCDLGCGYGYHLWLLKQHFPEKKYWGGEYSANAVAMAKDLYTDGSITVEQLDMSDTSFVLPFSKDDRILVVSYYALTCLPEESRPLEQLCAMKGPGWQFGFFEPLYECCSDTLLGQLRKAYILRNDYKHDLLTTLKARSDVRIAHMEPEHVGINACFPASFVCWK